MLLTVSSTDNKIIFFGAAAMAIRETEYMAATSNWLKSENIGGDVGPGSMPPSRAQIKQFNFLHGLNPVSINANMDNKFLIVKFLEDAGVSGIVAISFVTDLLDARVASTSGANTAELKELLVKHKLNDIIEIQGHGHFVK